MIDHFRHIRRLYFAAILAFGASLSLFVGLAVLCVSALSSLKSSSELINLAGRQRALSQRIASLTGIEVRGLNPSSAKTTSSSNLAEIAKASNTMRVQFERIRFLAAGLRDTPTLVEAHAALFSTEKHRNELLDAADAFLSEFALGEREKSNSHYSDVCRHSELFLPKMEHAVSALQLNRESEVQSTQTLIYSFFGIFGVVGLGFVGLPFLRPMELARAGIVQSLRYSDRVKQLAMIAEKTTNAAVFTDPMGRIVWVNDAFTRISGFSLQEVIGKVPGHFLQCDETCPETVERIRFALRNQQNFNGEILNRGKNGKKYWLNIDLQPCHDERGELTGFVALETDITERKRIQAELEESTQFMQGAIDSIGSHIAILDEVGTILYVNSQWKRFAQENDYRGADFGIGSNYLEIIRGDAVAGGQIAVDVEEGIRSVISGVNRVFEYEYPCDSPTEDRWFLMTVSRFGSVGKVRLVVTHQNITERKKAQFRLLDLNSQLTEDLNARIQAEEELQRANTYLDVYRKIVDHHAIVAETDTAGTIVAVNDAFCRISGYERSELLGKNHRILNSGLHPKSMWKEMYKAASAGGFWHGEICNRTKSGKLYWVDTTIAPLFNDAGKIRGYFAIRADITSLKQAQAQAEAANRSKSEFLANMSHEIRTPMTAILGYADILAESVQSGMSTDTAIDCIQTIKRNGEHLLSIINDILDISKIEADKMTAEKIKVSPLQVVRDVVEMMKVKSQAKGLKLDLLQEDSLPRTIITDPTRLRQILVNLVGNAIKFTETGTVTISVRMETNKPEIIVFDITDTGIGLTEEQMSRLFQSFEQVDTSMTRKYGGTGLGLRISKRLAEILGGDITVSCSLGGGCTFSASVSTGSLLDVENECSLASRTATECDPSHIAKKQKLSSELLGRSPLYGIRILLVEDGPDNQRLIAFHLRKAGAIVNIVENGKLAVERFTLDGTIEGELSPVAPIDLVLMDMQMPEMDGYEATRILRDKGCLLPILALTAHAMDGDKSKCLDAGCDFHLTKPIEKTTLIDACSHFGKVHRELMPLT